MIVSTGVSPIAILANSYNLKKNYAQLKRNACEVQTQTGNISQINGWSVIARTSGILFENFTLCFAE